jgi:hypothetical protein
MVEFFDPLKSFIGILQMGATFEEPLKLLEKKFVVITILFSKYEKVFGELMHLPAASERSLSK